jgi:hypothetical protein
MGLAAYAPRPSTDEAAGRWSLAGMEKLDLGIWRLNAATRLRTLQGCDIITSTS